jgi:flagellar hook-length control protein FliK
MLALAGLQAGTPQLPQTAPSQADTPDLAMRPAPALGDTSARLQRPTEAVAGSAKAAREGLPLAIAGDEVPTPATPAGPKLQALPEAQPPSVKPPLPEDAADATAQALQPTAHSAAPPEAAAVRDPRAVAPSAQAIDVAARIGTPAFADELGNRVVWMAGRGQQAAEFRIDPPHLGPVEVRLSLSNDQASLVLVSPHASVRDALQATLPRLQDTLAAAGINLGSVHVGAHSHSGEHTSERGQPHAERSAVSAITGQSSLTPVSGWLARGRGMVDIYV